MRILILIITLAFVNGLNVRTILAQGDFARRSPPPVSAEAQREMETRLAEARAQYESRPNNADAIIWLGRRLAYLGRFNESIEIYTGGIAKFPNDARFLRHRGHRYITLREFDKAIRDLEQATKLVKGKPDEVEPDGQPNARNIPTSTLQFNIWYHLGLAYYLTGKNQKALAAYQECQKVSNSSDRLVATSHWHYMTLRRLNLNAEAAKVLTAITEGMEVIENTSYHRLLLMYKGNVSAESLSAEFENQASSAASHSVLYGIGNWYLYNKQSDKAVALFRKMVASDQWTSFGFIAAEADLNRLSK